MRSKLNRMSVCFCLIATLAVAMMPGPGWAKTVNLRLGHSEAVANIRHDVCLFFVKRADELSKGEVKIEVFPAGVLGTHQGCQEQVAMGTLDFYITTAGLVSVFDPEPDPGTPRAAVPLRQLLPGLRLHGQALRGERTTSP